MEAQLKHAYRQHLIQAGVNQHQADQVCENLTQTELQVISEIWSTWGMTWEQFKQTPPQAT